MEKIGTDLYFEIVMTVSTSLVCALSIYSPPVWDVHLKAPSVVLN